MTARRSLTHLRMQQQLLVRTQVDLSTPRMVPIQRGAMAHNDALIPVAKIADNAPNSGTRRCTPGAVQAIKEHNLLLFPASPDACEACAKAKITRAPARAVPIDQRSDMAQRFGERIHVDTVGPIKEPMGYNHLLVTRDEATDYPMVLPLKVFISRITAAAFETLYPASAKPAILKCRPDNGSEFLGAFLSMLRRRHVELDKLPIPRRSETHSRAERFH